MQPEQNLVQGSTYGIELSRLHTELSMRLQLGFLDTPHTKFDLAGERQ